MRREEAREIPGTFGDPARFVEAAPGVVPTSSGLQSFFVRGAPPETTGYFLDGIAVPALYHVGYGPSVIAPGLLDHVDFFPGAAPAYFGRSIGGVIAGEAAEPSRRAHGEANLRLLDASGLVETPFEGGRGSVLLGGRYAYPGLIVPLFAPDVGLTYWDYQARATWNLSDHERVGAFVFGSYDRLTQKQTNAGGVPYTAQLVATEFHRADVRYDTAIGHASAFRLAATAGHDGAGNETSNLTDTLARLRAELDSRPSQTLRLRAGADVALDHYGIGSSPLEPGDPTTPPYGLPTTPRNDVVIGLRGDVVWRVSPRVEIVPGVRADLYTSRRIAPPAGASAAEATATPALDPRLATRVTLTPRVAAVSTVGISHQVPGLRVSSPDATPYLTSTGVEQGLQTSVQASQGVEVALPEGFLFSSTIFLHHYAGLPDLTAPCITYGKGPSGCVEQRVDGQAFGLELLLRRALTQKLAVWVAYTLSRTTREAHPFDPGEGVQWIPSEYDRTHVVSAVMAYDLGRRWRAGARFFGYTGRPYTHTYEGVPVAPFNTERLPGFFRLDVRLEKTWLFGTSTRVSVVVEGINVTLNKEVVDTVCQPRGPMSGGPPYAGGPLPPGAKYDPCIQDELGPITIPSIGVEGAF
jgi:hypothetical protein